MLSIVKCFLVLPLLHRMQKIARSMLFLTCDGGTDFKLNLFKLYIVPCLHVEIITRLVPEINIKRDQVPTPRWNHYRFIFKIKIEKT